MGSRYEIVHNMIRIQKDIEDSNRICVIDADKCKPKKMFIRM